MTLSQLRSVAALLDCTPSQIVSAADKFAKQLEAKGVQVPNEKEFDKGALLIGLGILFTLLAKG